jgi:Uma2 family endonuclease
MDSFTVRRPASWEDVLAAPENNVAELIDGELVLSSRPSVRNAIACARVLRSLDGDESDDVEGWAVFREVELHLGQPSPRSLVLVPDLSGWRSDRYDVADDAAAIEVVPDWVCEILSPGTHRHDRLVKMDIYARLGVGWAWLVDPAERTLEVFALRDGLWARVQVGGPEDRLTLQPFGVEVDLERWFR